MGKISAMNVLIHNCVRNFGEVIHVLSLVTIICKLRSPSGAKGASLNSFILQFIIRSIRYIDLFWDSGSVSSQSYKLFLLSLQTIILFEFGRNFKKTYEKNKVTHPI
eukprot:UN22572